MDVLKGQWGGVAPMNKATGHRAVARGRCRGRGHRDDRGVGAVVEATGQGGRAADVDVVVGTTELSPP